jgi:hypothetical protein
MSINSARYSMRLAETIMEIECNPDELFDVEALAGVFSAAEKDSFLALANSRRVPI